MGNRCGQMGNAASGGKFDFPGSTHPILEGFGSFLPHFLKVERRFDRVLFSVLHFTRI